jgi:SAM-dependent methyltransferase
VGIDLTGIRALAFANRVYKFDFRNTVTLGRHEIHFWKPEYDTVGKTFNFEYDDTLALGTFCEPLLRKLGAENITSIDASAFEGASLIHNFNLPVSKNLHGQFDAFLDFGTIEHIFNTAQVIDNIVKLIKPGGSILIATNANGFTAHGFFQYSPEFFYSVFSERNGFRDTSVFLVRTALPKTWHLIKRPGALKRRNDPPFEQQTQLLVFSRKFRDVDSLNVTQSDYDDTWKRFETGNWTSWNIERIPRWKKALHNFAGPFAYRSASYLSKSLEARRRYRADRLLINPDAIDPADFMKNVADSGDVRFAAPNGKNVAGPSERPTTLGRA